LPLNMKKMLTKNGPGRFWSLVFIFVLIAVLIIWDIAADLATGTTILHIVVEVLLFLVPVTGAFYFWHKFRVARQAKAELGQDLKKARQEASRWEEKEQRLLISLRKAIDDQFIQWGFSPTDKEIALHLLKGLSLKEIALLRGSSPNSIKQQSHVLYTKAGLKGRAGLSAFFLGNLLQSDVDTDIKS
jgi:DNA-binding CsgD family transcriptional regulator